jgi:hypothetical protein
VLSTIVTVCVRNPAVAGAKRQLAVQLSPFFRLVGQPQVCEKSAVGIVTEILRIVPPLLFVMVTVCEALTVPSNCLPKLSDEAERVNGGATPFPLKAAVCGLLVALSVTVNAPVRVPVVEGVNVTLTLQDPAAGTLRPALHVLDEARLKSPVIETLDIVIAVFWPLVSLTVWVALEPTVTLPNDTLLGLKLTAFFCAHPGAAPTKRRLVRMSV